MKPRAVWLPASAGDVYAIQAVAKGLASDEQQKRAFRCIVEEIAGAYEMTFDPESDRQTCFAEGRRHVGRVLVGLANLTASAVEDAYRKPAPPVRKPPRK